MTERELGKSGLKVSAVGLGCMGMSEFYDPKSLNDEEAYSPLSRGFLTGQFKTIDDLPADDWRRMAPRFQGENFQKNLQLVKKIEEMAAAKGCTPGQLALAWVLAQGNDIVPIPGTKRIKYLDDNLGAIKVRLTAGDLAEIDALLPVGAAAGERYYAQAMQAIDR